MVSSIARRLADAGQIRLAELLLSTGSLMLGNKLKIVFRSGNRWSHIKDGWEINDSVPDMRFDPAKHWKSIREFYFAHYEPKGQDVFVDVGAGIGLESVFLSRQPGFAGHIYAIEAAPATYQLLKANIEGNQLSNIETFNLALSDVNGTVLIGASETSHLANSLFTGVRAPVKSMTMDRFMEENQIREIDFLKVNIEGAEKLLIRFFERIRNVRHVAIACHDFLFRRNGNVDFKSKEEVSGFLKNNHFEIYSPNTGKDFFDDWLFGTNKQFQAGA